MALTDDLTSTNFEEKFNTFLESYIRREMKKPAGQILEELINNDLDIEGIINQY